MGDNYSDNESGSDDDHQQIKLTDIVMTFDTTETTLTTPESPTFELSHANTAEEEINVDIPTQTSPPETELSFKKPSKMSDYFNIIKNVQHMLDMNFCEAEVGEEEIKEAVLVAREVQVRMGEFSDEFGKKTEIEQEQNEMC